MARCESHLIKIVVLAAGSNALLGRYHSGMLAGFQSSEYIFELHHTGVRKKQTGIILRYNAAGCANVMAIFFKKR